MDIMNSIYNFLFADDIPNRILVKDKNLTFSIVLFYVSLVKIVIPSLMRNRKPFNLRKMIISYNFVLSIINAICGYKLVSFLGETWHLRCDAKNLPGKEYYINKIYATVWLIFLSKFVEFLDTIFFVLRKKDNQVSFLHVFHHSVMVLVIWYAIKKSEYGYYTIIALSINTCIHAVMYFYYGLAAFGPQMQKYLWWKRYLTLLQIMQFVTILVYSFIGFMTGCEKLDTVEIAILSFVFIVLLLFINFYIKSFKKKVS